MVSKSFCISVLLIAFSVAERGLAVRTKRSDEIASIPLSELLRQFHNKQAVGVQNQLIVMLIAADSGDRMYNLPVNVSTECLRTIKANWMLIGKLAVCQEATHLMMAAMDTAAEDLIDRKELNEHPLELVCKNIEKSFPESSMSSLFEKAKKEAASFVYKSHRPTYFSRFETSIKSLMLKVMVISVDSDLAKLLARYSFVNLLDNAPCKGSKRAYLFAKSCQAVAKEGQFEDKLQTIYEAAISNAVRSIRVEDIERRFENFMMYDQEKGLWWVHNMLIKFYSEISKDPNLKKRVDDMAAIIDKEASKEDLDFSILPTFHEVYNYSQSPRHFFFKY